MDLIEYLEQQPKYVEPINIIRKAYKNGYITREMRDELEREVRREFGIPDITKYPKND